MSVAQENMEEEEEEEVEEEEEQPTAAVEKTRIDAALTAMVSLGMAINKKAAIKLIMGSDEHGQLPATQQFASLRAVEHQLERRDAAAHGATLGKLKALRTLAEGKVRLLLVSYFITCKLKMISTQGKMA